MQIRCTQADHQNQQIIGVCIDITCQNQRPYCHFCLTLHVNHLPMLTPFNLLNEWIYQRIIRVNNAYNNIQELKVSLDNLMNQFYPYFNYNIHQISELGLSQIDRLIAGLCQIEDCEKVLFLQLKPLIEQVKSTINDILKKTKNQSNLKENINNQIQHNINQLNLEYSGPFQQLKQNIKPIKFELLKQYSIKQGERCNSVAFNKDCSIVAVGCESLIKIFEFKQGILQQTHILNQHKHGVSALYFMKKSNQFISGDYKGFILIWASNHVNQWICSQIVRQQNDIINCLILNNNEDIIISSSNDNTIKFWTKKNEWICQQTITDHKRWISQLSFNEKQNQIISCGWERLILVIEYSEQVKKWMVIQKIPVDCQGLRLCFINDNLFTFQPKKGNLIYVYEMNSLSKSFTKTKHITVNQGDDTYQYFPQQYIKSKQFLVSKHDKYINLIRKTDNDEFQVEYSIQFGSQALFGQMSDDGEYLITWDDLSKEIQIRRCIEE
ncbi:unnamed protein product [Paramecium octaurelia]|uniref:Uncharacterized protein n=1 Tax=Paramecium octaurelia TaxID=43137 RepID=A0A8S1YMN9_PAROT|nr:unnamed protein product [Paramecium octaurelia]